MSLKGMKRLSPLLDRASASLTMTGAGFFLWYAEVSGKLTWLSASAILLLLVLIPALGLMGGLYQSLRSISDGFWPVCWLSLAALSQTDCTKNIIVINLILSYGSAALYAISITAKGNVDLNQLRAGTGMMTVGGLALAAGLAIYIAVMEGILIAIVGLIALLSLQASMVRLFNSRIVRWYLDNGKKKKRIFN